VDDVLIFTNGTLVEGKSLKEILELFQLAMGMVVNEEKSVPYFNGMADRLKGELLNLFHF
jgi:hypothetical protein